MDLPKRLAVHETRAARRLDGRRLGPRGLGDVSPLKRHDLARERIEVDARMRIFIVNGPHQYARSVLEAQLRTIGLLLAEQDLLGGRDRLVRTDHLADITAIAARLLA